MLLQSPLGIKIALERGDMKKILIIVTAILSVSGYLLLAGNRVGLTSDAEAASAAMTISVNCIAPTPAAFVPSIVVGYTLAKTAGPDGLGSATTCATHSVDIFDAVNGDDSVAGSRCSFFGDSGLPKVMIEYKTPIMKMSGFMCRQESAAGARVYLKDNSNDRVAGVYIESPSARSPVHNIKNADMENAKTVFGSDGYLGRAIQDGNDADGMRNGEIVFGGYSASSGGTKTFVVLNALEETGRQQIDMGVTFNMF